MDPQRQEPVVTSAASAFEAGLERSSAAILKKVLSVCTLFSFSPSGVVILVGFGFHISPKMQYFRMISPKEAWYNLLNGK